MKHIDKWADLHTFGIHSLTGEADAFGMRTLCDLTQRGKEYLERYWGGHVEIRTGSNWNSGDPEDPHVASVLLAYKELESLGEFLLRLSCIEVAKLQDGGLKGAEDDEDREYLDNYEGIDTIVWRRKGNYEDRNRHAMTGRWR